MDHRIRKIFTKRLLQEKEDSQKSLP